MASDAASPPPSLAPTMPANLFEAASRDDVEGLVRLYATTARDAIVSYAALRRRWGGSSRSFGRGASAAEEKLDEFFQLRRDASLSSPRSSSRRRGGGSARDDGSPFETPPSSPRNGRRGAPPSDDDDPNAPSPAEEMTRELDDIIRFACADGGGVASDDGGDEAMVAATSSSDQQHEYEHGHPAKKKTRQSTGPLAAHPSDVAAAVAAGADAESYADEALKSTLAALSRDEVERVVRESASLLTNSRPPSSFALFPRENAERLKRRERLREGGADAGHAGGGVGLERDHSMDDAEGDGGQLKSADGHKEGNNDDDGEEEYDDDEDEEESPPLFDGSVANATPGGGPIGAAVAGSAAGGGGGSGTVLHLACAMDAPFALAAFLAMGGDASSRHTAFRRAVVHEAACADSPGCLSLLLELGRKYGDEMMLATDGGGGAEIAAAAAAVAKPPAARSLFGGWSMRTRSGGKSSSVRSSSSDMDTDDVAGADAAAATKKKPAPAVASFVATLRSILTLGQATLDGTATDLEAARSLMGSVNLPGGTKAALVTTCYPMPQRRDRDRDRDHDRDGKPSSFHVTATATAAMSPADILMPTLSIGALSLPRLPAAMAASAHHRHIPSGPAPNADGHGNTPLHWAAFKNSASCVAVLLSHNVDPNARAEPSGWTPLHDAAYSDAAQSLALLVKAGVDVDARANSGATPLCFAAQEDAPGATKLLLEAGADATVRCCGHGHGGGGGNAAAHGEGGGGGQHQHGHQSRFSGYTPLHYCAHYNARLAARVLLDHQRRRAYAYAPLGEAESMLEVPDLNGKLPIHVAVARGSSDVLRELLRGGARVDTTPTKLLAAVASSSSSSSSARRQLGRPATPTGPAPSQAAAAADANNIVAQAARAHPSPPSTPRRAASAPAAAAGFASPVRSPQSSPTAGRSSSPRSPSVVTPVSSPVLRAMIPSRPVSSSKPWNCLTQRSIDECRTLIREAELNWTPSRHALFHPTDRRAVLEVLRVGKRLEQMGTGIFVELWPCVLSFCGRGWFEPEGGGGQNVDEDMDRKVAARQTATTAPDPDGNGLGSDDMELTQFRLDG